MKIGEIAKELGIAEATVRVLLARGLKKIKQDGRAGDFAGIILQVQHESAIQTHIKCGSIECRPEKWA
jgi:predicted transcriptional regulator